MKLYNYLQAKREASEEAIEINETDSAEHETGFLEILDDAIKIEFKPETLPRYQNLLFTLYRVGYVNQSDRNRLKKFTVNRVAYIILRYKSEITDINECTGETTVGQGFKEFKVIISETRKGANVTSAEMIIENKDENDLMFIERCIDVSGLEYRIIDDENGMKTSATEYEDHTGKISELISTESDDPDFPEIKEAIKWLKYKKVLKS